MSAPSSHQPALNLLLKASEVADILRVSLRTVRRLIASGELGIVRVGRCVRVHESVLQAFIAKRAKR